MLITPEVKDINVGFFSANYSRYKIYEITVYWIDDAAMVEWTLLFDQMRLPIYYIDLQFASFECDADNLHRLHTKLLVYKSSLMK